MPPVAEDQNNVRALKQAAQRSGWKRIASRIPREGDIVVMRDGFNLHCGVAVTANGGVGVLHSHRGAGVVFEPLRYAAEQMKFELWRSV